MLFSKFDCIKEHEVKASYYVPSSFYYDAVTNVLAKFLTLSELETIRATVDCFDRDKIVREEDAI